MFKYIGDIVKGTGTQLRSLAMVFSHGFRKRDTLQYPEEPVYLPPRYRGRIVLTRRGRLLADAVVRALTA